MKALILAGGKGTRLGKKTEFTPKPLIKIVGKPVLEYQIELLSRYGFKDIIILINHLGEKIKKYFGDGSKWNVKIKYFEEDVPLGTAGGIKELEKELSNDFLVLYGDLLLNIDLNRLKKFHNKKKKENSRCAGTLAVHPNNHPRDSDLVDIDDNNRIINFLPKPHPDNLIYRNLVNAAIYILTPNIFHYIHRGTASDFGKNIFPDVLKKKRDIIFAYNSPEYMKDMGTPDRLKQAEKDVHSGKYDNSSLAIKKPAIFIDRDGVINEEVDQLSKLEDFRLIEGADKAIKKINEVGYLAVVVTNQPMIAKGFCSYQDVLNIHKKMETLLGKTGAKIDGIYFCPHHPEKGFPGENKRYKIKCVCRKPQTGLIEKAMKELNIDLKNSYLIGDSTIDAMTAKNAGLSFIGVSTGYHCKDDKYNVNIPQKKIKKNFLSAINLIFHQKNLTFKKIIK